LEQSRILLIICAIVSTALLMIQSSWINPINEASALQQGTTTTTLTPLAIRYINISSTKTWAVEVEGTLGSTAYFVRVIDANTTNTVSVLNITSSLQSGGAYNLRNLSCDLGSGGTGSSGLCALGFFTSTGGKVSRVVLFDAINNVASGLNSGANFSTSYSPIVAYSHGLNQDTIFTSFIDVGVANHLLVQSWVVNNTQSIALASNRMVLAGTLDTGLVFPGVSVVESILGSIPSGTQIGNYIGMTLSNGQFELVKASTNSWICGVSLGGGNGDIDFVNNGDTTNYWLGTASTTNIKKINFACSVLTTSDFTAATGGNIINGITHSPSRHELYFQSNSKIFVANLTTLSTTVITNFAITSNPSILHGNMITNDQWTSSGVTGQFVASLTNSLRVQWVFWGVIGGGGGGTGSSGSVTTCVDVGTPGGAKNLICITCPGQLGTQQAVSAQCPNGYPNFGAGGSGQPPSFRGSLNGSQSLNAWACLTGYFSCTNTNTQTNGVGFAALIIVIIASTLVLLWGTWRTHHEIRDVVFPIILVDTLWCGAFWQMNLTTAIPFYVAILGIVGFASVKIYDKVTGGEHV